MLLMLCVTVVLCCLAVLVVAKGALAVLARLGIDPMTGLLWLGLAEWPIDQPRAQRQRLGHVTLQPSRTAS